MLSLLAVCAQAAQRADEELAIPFDAEPARYVENIDGDTIVVELENVQGD
jgi:endonuclease YncB( thermonuclease family)